MTSYNSTEHYQQCVDLKLVNMNNVLKSVGMTSLIKELDPIKKAEYEGLTFTTLEDFSFENPSTITNLKDTVSRFFANIMASVDWTRNLSIDGPSAMGKSTMLKGIPSTKVNKYITCNKNNCYNNIPVASHAYLTTALALHEQTGGLIYDRSPVSNIAYGLCFYIMSAITNNLKTYRTFNGLCDEYIRITNMLPTLEYVNAKNLQTLIVIDSSFEHYSARFNARGYAVGSVSDIIKSQVYEYWLAQTAAFVYLANALNYHCLDLQVLRNHYDEVPEDCLLQILSETFQETYYCYGPNEIKSNVKINPQDSGLQEESLKNLTLTTFALSTR